MAEERERSLEDENRRKTGKNRRRGGRKRGEEGERERERERKSGKEKSWSGHSCNPRLLRGFNLSRGEDWRGSMTTRDQCTLATLGIDGGRDVKGRRSEGRSPG